MEEKQISEDVFDHSMFVSMIVGLLLGALMGFCLTTIDFQNKCVREIDKTQVPVSGIKKFIVSVSGEITFTDGKNGPFDIVKITAKEAIPAGSKTKKEENKN